MMKTLFALIAMSLLALTSAAQDATGTPTESETSAVLRVLSIVPAAVSAEDANPQIDFGAYHEALTASGVEIPQDWDDYINGDQTALNGAIPDAGPRSLLENLDEHGGRYPELVGFDFFEVEYAASFGLQSQTGTVLAGAFDTDAVTEAHTARGYTIERQDDDGTLLCPSDGCDSGLLDRLDQVELANPFGGNLGRQQPVFVADGLILTAPDIAVLESMIAARADDVESLADLPEYQAIVAALAGTTYTALRIGTPDEATALANANSDAVREMHASAPLPRYSLVVVAFGRGEFATEITIALTYEDEADAAAAVTAIDTRADLPVVKNMQDESMISHREYYQLLGVAFQPTQTLPDLAEGWTVVVSALTPVMDPADADLASFGLYMPLVNLYEVSDVE